MFNDFRVMKAIAATQTAPLSLRDKEVGNLDVTCKSANAYDVRFWDDAESITIRNVNQARAELAISDWFRHEDRVAAKYATIL